MAPQRIGESAHSPVPNVFVRHAVLLVLTHVMLACLLYLRTGFVAAAFGVILGGLSILWTWGVPGKH
jgi:hypothetical protein